LGILKKKDVFLIYSANRYDNCVLLNGTSYENNGVFSGKIGSKIKIITIQKICKFEILLIYLYLSSKIYNK
jgi:hypothetical protein